MNNDLRIIKYPINFIACLWVKYPNMSHISTHYPPVSLFKRLLTIIYDLLLLLAVLFIVGTVIAAVATMLLNDGQAITEEHEIYTLYQIIVLISLLLSSFIFYGWFWTHGGQTLGMRTWRVQLQTCDGSPVTWKIAAIRFLTALLSWLALGLGFIWSLVDKQKRTWHDLASKTVLLQLNKS